MIHDVPTQCWNQDGIGKIASLIGRPMYTDKATESKRMPFVRVCAEVRATDELPEQVSMIVDGNYTINLVVEYNWVPSRCLHCKLFGYSDTHYLEREYPAPEAPKASTTAMNKTTQKKVWSETQKDGRAIKEIAEATKQPPQMPTDSHNAFQPLDQCIETEATDPHTNSEKEETLTAPQGGNLHQPSPMPVGSDYLDEGFQLSKSSLKRIRKNKWISEKEMREAEVREPPSKEKYTSTTLGKPASTSKQPNPKPNSQKGRGNGNRRGSNVQHTNLYLWG
ncbi:hypothetical protein GIB67_041897 [Kingdonia uniflora]|uniref:DUF4283 domain-containing protein n=1 Tax=Kingdonia uniflora TaxID=39325 RepID=A0A7J7LYW0_9MAGN|nr:hypothetical protein GIB67_041897 [Kingdonia uniflora]